MDTARVSLILHGCRWPEPSAVQRLRALVRAALGAEAEVVEAREAAGRAVGAAALVNRAATTTGGRLVVAAEPAVAWTANDLAAVAKAAESGLALADQSPRCRLWGAPRDAFDALGGLDDRLWSVGEVEDLEARARCAGFRVSRVGVEGEWRGPEPYPLRAETRALLEIRNPLITAFKTEPADRLGRLLATSALVHLLDASRRSGFDPARFGFEEARPGPLRAGGPADGPGTLIPLLALDSLLDQLPDLLADRKWLARRDRASRGDAPAGEGGAHRGPDRADLVTLLAGLAEARR